MDLPYVTEDLVRLILLKLPSVRSVFRLCCVCKSWRDFIKDHYLRVDNEVCRSKVDVLFSNNNDDPFLAFCKHEKNGYYHMRTSAPTSQSFGRVNIPYDAFGMVGSCNGLLCLRQPCGKDGNVYKLHLYNPITREYRMLPSSIVVNFHYKYQGFGFDASSNDYKVVSIRALDYAEIYKLSTNRWSRLSNVNLRFDETYSFVSTSCVYVNGFCYWRLYHRGYGSSSPRKILAFDLKTETFDHIDFPATNLGVINSSNELGVLDNSLALCRVVNPIESKTTVNTEVWMMSERDNMGRYSWIKKFTIISVDLVRKGGACWARGSNAFQLNKGGYVITLGTKEEEGKGHKARTRSFRFDCTRDRTMVFKPSLVSLGSGRFMPRSRH